MRPFLWSWERLLDVEGLKAFLGHSTAAVPPLGERHSCLLSQKPHPDPEHLCAQEILPWHGQRWMPSLPSPCAIWEESDAPEAPLQTPPGAGGTFGGIQPSLLAQGASLGAFGAAA